MNKRLYYLKILSQSFNINNHEWTYVKEKYSPNGYISDSSNIFGPELKINVTESMLNNSEFISIDVDGELLSNNGQLTVAISAEDDHGLPIEDINGNPIYINRDLEQMISKNGKAYFGFSAPKQLSINDKLKIYLWNRNGQPIAIRNIRISIIDNIWN